MSEQENNNLAVSMAQLREQIKGIAANVEEIKVSVSEVVSLDRSMAELAIHNQQSQKNIELLWERVDQGKAGSEQLAKDINVVNDKVSAALNKASGAAWVLGSVLGVLQAVLIGAVAWVFANVTENDATNRLLQQRMAHLEQELMSKGGGK